MDHALEAAAEAVTQPALWVLLGVIISAVLGYLGVRYTARTSKSASEYSAILAAPDNISAGYDRLNDDLWRTVTDLKNDVAALKTEASIVQGRYRAAIYYIRRLLSLLTLHAPHIHPPEPPVELREDVRVNGTEDPTQ
jgi:hypothetical protein